MAYKTYARQSVTLPQGISFARTGERLNALAILAHGWRSPARVIVEPNFAARRTWHTPLMRWTRPLARAA